MNWKGYGNNPRLIEALSCHFPEGADETHEKPDRIASVSTEIQTKHNAVIATSTCLVIPSNCDAVTEKI
jgi:hypothetical protein